VCAGAGGQALGLERAGFRHLALVEMDEWCVETLKARRSWRRVIRAIDVHEWTAKRFTGEVDLFAGGVPCPPFSRAGQKLGEDDARDLFPSAIRLIGECEPRAVLLENVRGLLAPRFAEYRERVIEAPLRRLGYHPGWRLLNACDFGVPQLRPRAIMVALRSAERPYFRWPTGDPALAPTVGAVLQEQMGRNGWPGAADWAKGADSIAPTLVGGSKKHGGPDLGPTQARKRWAEMGVDGLGVADEAPPPDFNGGMPKLTVQMAAVLQGFPKHWPFRGGKTAAYRQVGNAFPPPVAEALGRSIAAALAHEEALGDGPPLGRIDGASQLRLAP
jgi:DNA (cytosine-5)-methyltransferase 1